MAPQHPLHGPDDFIYWEDVREEARRRKSDGCTGVADFFLDCCLQHDIEWGGKTIDGEPISRTECNARFRTCIQSRSKFGRWSPMAQIRWLGVWVGTGAERLKKKLV